MASTHRVKTALRRLKAAVETRSQSGQLVAGGLAMTAAGELMHAESGPRLRRGDEADDGRGECYLLCQSILDELDAPPTDPTASGPAWDGTLLRILLEFLMRFLKGA